MNNSPGGQEQPLQDPQMKQYLSINTFSLHQFLNNGERLMYGMPRPELDLWTGMLES